MQQNIHGGDIYSRQIRLDFSVNGNPLGMPDAAVQAIHEAAVKFQSGGKHIDSPVRSGNSGISSVPSGAELTEQATGISYGEPCKSL